MVVFSSIKAFLHDSSCRSLYRDSYNYCVTVDCPACQIGCRWYKHGKSFTMISISLKVPHFIKSYTCEKDFIMLRHKMRYGDLKCLDLIKYSQSVVVIGLVKRDPEFKFA